MVYRVMLINAPVFSVVESWYDTPDFVRTGLAYVAGYLRQFPGFEIKILDCKYERLDFQQALKEVLEFKPDLVGFTAFTNEIKPSDYLALLIKQHLPETKFVLGGVHITALPKETLDEFPVFDCGVIGEGEITFLELCIALRDKKPLSKIAGLSFRENNEIVVTDPRERILDQNTIPFPAWDLLPKAHTYIVMSQRGCPFNCTFCMNPNGRIARTRTIDNVIEEIEYIIKKFNPKQIMFGDELFSVDMDRTKELLTEYHKNKFHEKVTWWAQTHVRFVDYELFTLCRKTNVSIIGLGIETGDEEKLKQTGKGTNLQMIVDARSAAKKANVSVETYFIIGQPDETIESINKTIELAVKLNPTLPIFGLMSPYPGTLIAKLAANNEAGYKLVTTDWDEYNKQIGGALEFANLSRKQIEILQLKAYCKVFLLNNRYVDFVKFLWHYKSGAWSVVKKFLGYNQKIKNKEDYKKIKLRHNSILNNEDMIDATVSWQKWQVAELRRAKKNSQKINVNHI
jgi:anaerobic magnesium-protoporphyrin IX monomethyl ester cyclase